MSGIKRLILSKLSTTKKRGKALTEEIAKAFSPQKMMDVDVTCDMPKKSYKSKK